MDPTHFQNIARARRELGLGTQTALADFLGISKRTVIRHSAAGGLAGSPDLQKIVDALAAKNPALATDLARGGGLHPPALPAPEPTPASPGPSKLNGKVPLLRLVEAAANALDVSPRRARAGLRAFFRAAAKLDADLDATAQKLAGAPRSA